MYLLEGSLPWQGVVREEDESMQDWLGRIKRKKEESEKTLAKNLPDEFQKYMQYCLKLQFKQDPDYDYLLNLFTDLMEKEKIENDNYFDWIVDKSRKRDPTIISAEESEF